MHIQKIMPCLWFDGEAEEAARFYVSIFPGSKMLQTVRRPENVPGPSGILTVWFELAGQPFMALNAGPQFKFTEAISLMVNCDSQQELDTYWEKLSTGGKEVQCGWLKDKFGLAWQIVPSILPEFFNDADSARTARVMQAVMGMIKLDIAGLKRAYDGP